MGSTILKFGFIIVAGLIAYCNVFVNRFTKWDDEWLIFENPHIHDLSWSNLAAIFDPFIDRQFLGGEYLPVRDLSWLVDHLFFGGNPVGFHLGDVLLHCLNSVCVYVIARQFLGPHRARAAVFVGVLFAVHPVHTESVTWMASRKDVLSGWFVFSALCVAGSLNPRAAGWFRRGRLGAALIVFVLYAAAVLSKSTAIILPLLLMLQDVALRRVRQGVRERIAWAARYVPLFALALVISLVVGMTSGESGLRSTGYHGGGLFATLWIQTKAFWDYIVVLLIPIKLRTAVVVPRVAVFDAAHVLAGLVVVPAVVWGMIWGIREWFSSANPNSGPRRWDVVGLTGFTSAWFFIGLIPVSNLVPMNWIFCERYLYLPSFGVCFLLGVGADSLILSLSGRASRVARRLAVSLLAMAIGLLTARTLVRNRDWRDNLVLWTVTVGNDPGNLDARFSYAKALEGRSDLDAAIGVYEEILREDSVRVDTRLNLSSLLIRRNRPGDFERCEEVLRGGIRIDESNSHFYKNLAVLSHQKGDFRGAIVNLGTAAKLDPIHRLALAEVLFTTRRLRRASEVIESVLTDDPWSVPNLRLAARIALARGDREVARERVMRALEIAPDKPGLRKILSEIDEGE